MAYTTGEYCRRIAQAEYDNFVSGSFADNVDLENFIDLHLIPKAEGIIEDYCRQSWTEATVPESVKEGVAQVVVRMLRVMLMNKQGPLVKTGDYRVEFADFNILTQYIKDLVQPNVYAGKFVNPSDYQTDDIKSAWGE